MTARAVFGPSAPLRGTIHVPGDKSITHRALLLAALAEGESRIEGALEAEDCAATRGCLEALGVEFACEGDALVVRGGRTRWHAPAAVLWAGNSGTTARLLLGLLAGCPFTSELDGDDSLRRRPFARVLEPLRAMGARIEELGAPGRLPLRILGRPLAGGAHELPIASAQVKSCLLLAGLLASGTTSVSEPAASRDHTERMLPLFGVEVRRAPRRAEVTGGATLRPARIRVPGDPSSAAFPIVAALMVPDSEVRVLDLNGNPARLGAFAAMRQMGGQVAIEAHGVRDGEPLVSIRALASTLRGTRIGGDLIPTLIDELPALGVLATQASGLTEVRDAAELRVKESDRIGQLVTELRRLGATIEERPDGFRVTGGVRLRAGAVDSGGDHRLAMSLALAALCASGSTTIQQADCVGISFPGFFDLLRRLGAEVN
jgi:3-phosphoshikimate 1-carboxyvinyltransferase